MVIGWLERGWGLVWGLVVLSLMAKEGDCLNSVDKDNDINDDGEETSKVDALREGAGGGIQGVPGRDREMAPIPGNPIHRSSSRPQLDLSKAAIQGNFEERDPTILLPNQSDDISHLALDIGGRYY